MQRRYQIPCDGYHIDVGQSVWDTLHRFKDERPRYYEPQPGFGPKGWYWVKRSDKTQRVAMTHNEIEDCQLLIEHGILLNAPTQLRYANSQHVSLNTHGKSNQLYLDSLLGNP